MSVVLTQDLLQRARDSFVAHPITDEHQSIWKAFEWMLFFGISIPGAFMPCYIYTQLKNIRKEVIQTSL